MLYGREICHVRCSRQFMFGEMGAGLNTSFSTMSDPALGRPTASFVLRQIIHIHYSEPRSCAQVFDDSF